MKKNNINVIYGLNKGIIERKLKNILEDIHEYDMSKYDMNTATIKEIIEDATTISLFSKQKVIILENALFLSANKTILDLEELEKYIEHPSESSYLILICNTEKIDTRKKINKLLAKYTVIEANKLEKKELINYIEESLKKDHYQIDNIELFLKKAGTDLFNIQNELDKLKNYCLKDKIIHDEDIEKIILEVNEEDIFALTDAIILEEKEKSLKLLESFLHLNYDEIQIIALLATQFHFLFQVKRLLQKNKTEAEIAKILEVNPYRVKFTIKKLYFWPEEKILTCIKRLAKIDHDIKLGLMDKNLALKLFILQNNNEY